MFKVSITKAKVMGFIFLTSFKLVSAQNFLCPVAGQAYGSNEAAIILFNWIFSVSLLTAIILLIIWLIKQIQKIKLKN